MTKPGRPATISDVAALASVSVGTASKALNGNGSLRPETRQRVLHAAERLGFRPNAAARALNEGRTYTVGMITTDSIGRFSIPILMGAENALGAGRMSVFLCDARDDPIREEYYLHTLLGRRVDGIIVTGRRSQARPPIAADQPVPVVYAFISSTDPQDCSVVPDEAGGAGKAIEHLLAVGRRRIAHVTGPEHHHSAQVRSAAARARLADDGLDLVLPPCTASGAKAGAARPRACSWPPVPTWTPSSAAATRSLGASPTACAPRVCGSRTTSPWWASTTGTSWRWPANHR
ncbi:hypothetical protein Prum_090300 [Phytohabitans rumicis]|uniref:HTH lacI-type domain-containing protein n=1 Tax=Phytohabitans rumicis TaxID=1076125 RepID=A0A6V8LKI1_9ACTN|nr:hypothetical protein Prum_090300 [Phytohabitans rumicis]